MRHTPLPWIAEHEGGRGSWIGHVSGAWSALSCGRTDAEADTNADLIVTAVNSLHTIAPGHEHELAEVLPEIYRLLQALAFGPIAFRSKAQREAQATANLIERLSAEVRTTEQQRDQARTDRDLNGKHLAACQATIASLKAECERLRNAIARLSEFQIKDSNGDEVAEDTLFYLRQRLRTALSGDLQ